MGNKASISILASIGLRRGAKQLPDADERHKNVYSFTLKTSEFLRWLRARGVKIEGFGKGSHLKVSLNEGHSVIPMHPTKEIGKGLVEKIKKDLGLK